MGCGGLCFIGRVEEKNRERGMGYRAKMEDGYMVGILREVVVDCGNRNTEDTPLSLSLSIPLCIVYSIRHVKCEN